MPPTRHRSSLSTAWHGGMFNNKAYAKSNTEKCYINFISLFLKKKHKKEDT